VSFGLDSSESVRIKRGYMNGAEPTHADLLLQETGRRRYRAIVEALRDGTGEAVLDLGCGEGNLADMLSLDGIEPRLLLGLDLDRSKLLSAAWKGKLNGRAAFVRGDAESLPIKAGSFGVVVATEILEHVPDASRCLSEVKRIGPDRVIVTVPSLRYPMFLFAIGSERIDGWLKNPGSVSTPFRVAKAILRGSLMAGFPLFLLAGIRKVRRLGYYDYRLYHGHLPHRLYTTPYLVSLLRDHGFKVEQIRGVGFSVPLIPELEVLLKRRGMSSLARVFARVQAELDVHFSRIPDHSQNIMVVATISRNR
jgi:2-polyprenyl-3-methyl-5-hydroxy-6-metoxy-1,4-benzoquinol methylase